MDLVKIVDGSPVLAGEGYIRLEDAAHELGIQPRVLLQDLSNHGIKLFCRPPVGQTAYVGVDSKNLDRDWDGALIVDAAFVDGQPTVLTAWLTYPDTKFGVDSILQKGAARSFHFEITDGGGDAYFERLVPLTLADVNLWKPDVERVRRHYAANLADEALAAARIRAATPALPTARHLDMRVSELFDRYCKEKTETGSWKPAQQTQMPRKFQPFVDLMGDPAIGQIDSLMVDEYLARLQRLPAESRALRSRCPGMTAADLVRWADENDVPRMSLQTAKSYARALSEVFKWANVEKHLIPFNPARGAGRKAKKAHREQDERSAFSDADLRLIFGAYWFVHGSGKATRTGEYLEFLPHYYWLPLLGLFTGGRLNELSQLYLDDVQVSSPKGVTFVEFRLGKADQLNVDGPGSVVDDKSLKTPNAKRVVPVHSFLLDRGFLDYVDALRVAGHTRLFPELTFNRLKGYGRGPSSWFNERFLGGKLKIDRDGTKTFHSFRHTFTTALGHLRVPEIVIAQLVGHERGFTQAGKRYLKDEDAEQLKPDMERLAFDLPPIASFDVDKGLIALKHAIVRKAGYKARANPAKP